MSRLWASLKQVAGTDTVPYPKHNPLTGTPLEKRKQVFKEFGKGKLHIGKSSKLVTNPKQATAIAFNVSGKSKRK